VDHSAKEWRDVNSPGKILSLATRSNRSTRSAARISRPISSRRKLIKPRTAWNAVSPQLRSHAAILDVVNGVFESSSNPRWCSAALHRHQSGATETSAARRI
jgi:hypothetical protein